MFVEGGLSGPDTEKGAPTQCTVYFASALGHFLPPLSEGEDIFIEVLPKYLGVCNCAAAIRRLLWRLRSGSP